MTWCNTTHWPDRASWAVPNPVCCLCAVESSCGSEYLRRARCGKTARRDLCGGCQVTGSPTAIHGVKPAPLCASDKYVGPSRFFPTDSARERFHNSILQIDSTQSVATCRKILVPS